MIEIIDHVVHITFGRARLKQGHHPVTGKTFASVNECKKWIKESGFFDQFKIELSQLLKQQASKIIEQQAPLFKQLNAALGIYDEPKTEQIKQTIIAIQQKVEAYEAKINQAKTLEALKNLLQQMPTLWTENE